MSSPLEERMNPDLWATIMSLLDVGDLAQLSQVSRHLNQIVHPFLWRDVLIMIPWRRLTNDIDGIEIGPASSGALLRSEKPDLRESEPENGDGDEDEDSICTLTMELLSSSTRFSQHVRHLTIFVDTPLDQPDWYYWNEEPSSDYTPRIARPIADLIIRTITCSTRLQRLTTCGEIFIDEVHQREFAKILIERELAFQLHTLTFRESWSTPYLRQGVFTFTHLTDLCWHFTTGYPEGSENEGSSATPILARSLETFFDILEASVATLERLTIYSFCSAIDHVWKVTLPKLRSLTLADVYIEGPGESDSVDEEEPLDPKRQARDRERKEHIAKFFFNHPTLEELHILRDNSFSDWSPPTLDPNSFPNLTVYDGPYPFFERLLQNQVKSLETNLLGLELYSGGGGLRGHHSYALSAFFYQSLQAACKPSPNKKKILSGLAKLSIDASPRFGGQLDDLFDVSRLWASCCGDTLRKLRMNIQSLKGTKIPVVPFTEHQLVDMFSGFRRLRSLQLPGGFLIVGNASRRSSTSEEVKIHWNRIKEDSSALNRIRTLAHTLPMLEEIVIEMSSSSHYLISIDRRLNEGVHHPKSEMVVELEMYFLM